MRILFVCTGNTCRSPMAERLARKLYPGHEFESAGVAPASTIHEMSARVLTERGADPSGFQSRSIFHLDLLRYDKVVLIGETARDLAPNAPTPVEEIYWDVTDPYDAVGTPEEILKAYRDCADDITERLNMLMDVQIQSET